MKKWLLFVLAGLLCACDDTECGKGLPFGPHPKFSISGLTITQTTEGSTAIIKKLFEYDDNMLSAHTIEQSSTTGIRLISFDITTKNTTACATSHTYYCKLNNNYYYDVVYSVNPMSLATAAKYKYREGDPRGYTMEYTTIDGKQYLKSITESILPKDTLFKDTVQYVLTFDYSRFGSGEIGLTQTLLGKDRVRATLRVTHDNTAGIPDVHLNDGDFHPLDKHFEAVYGGLFGTFDYTIAKIQKETQTAIYTTTETIESSVEFDTDGYPHKITSVSDKPSKKTKYYAFEYQ